MFFTMNFYRKSTKKSIYAVFQYAQLNINFDVRDYSN